MEDPRIQFGRRLQLLRKQRGWTQEQLAFECGLDRTYIGGVERGERNIGLLNICKIADALKVTPKDILDFRKARRK